MQSKSQKAEISDASGDRGVSGASHTPTPWFQTGGVIWIDGRYLECCGRGHQECCGDPDVAGGQEQIAQAGEGDAAFIVQAVNNFDTLIEVLEDCRKFLSDLTAPDAKASSPNIIASYGNALSLGSKVAAALASSREVRS